jgi:DNA-binding transcriptional ArsR family regulator
LAANHREVCVCEVVDALGISQPTVSKAFKALKEAGLVADRRDANWIYYRLNEAAPEWVSEVVHTTIDALSGGAAYVADGTRFEKSRIRETQDC